jgi:hypothetical protein
MVEIAQAGLRDLGIDDEVLAAGQFSPRGHTGGAFLGGMLGSEVGGAFGGVGDAVGLVAGFGAGRRVADSRAGLPPVMLVAVSASFVYGFDSASRSREPSDLVFQVPRSGLTVEVHQRVNVRILELIEAGSGSRIELEGNRVPLTHSKDVIDLLAHGA